jgi:hypothetical protein
MAATTFSLFYLMGPYFFVQPRFRQSECTGTYHFIFNLEVFNCGLFSQLPRNLQVKRKQKQTTLIF